MPHLNPVSGGFGMKRQMVGLALLGAALFATVGSAYGFGRKKDDCGSPCGMTAGYGSPCANYAVSYVNQTVTVNEWVPVQEQYTYWENVAETRKEKVKVKEAAWKEEAFKYTVNELVASKEKVKVKEGVTEEEGFTYTDNAVAAVKEKVKVKEAAWKEEAFKYTVNELVASKEKVKVKEAAWKEEA